MGNISVPNKATKQPSVIKKASFSLDMETGLDMVTSQQKWAHKKRIERLKSQPKIVIGSEVAKPWARPEVFRVEYENGTSAYRLPTPKNWNFVKYYLETGSKVTAYKKAGYSHVAYNIDQRADQVLSSRGVQLLLQLVMSDFIEKRKISSQVILNKALEVYDRCETVSEQLNTLKFIKSLIPKGVTNCQKKDCPLKPYWRKK